MKILARSIIPALFSVIVLIALFMSVDSMGTFVDMLRRASYRYLIYIMAVFALIFVFRSMRINSLINTGGSGSLISICTIHNFLNRLFPFGIGDLSLPILLKKIRKTDYVIGVNAFILLRLMDIFMVALIFTVSYLYVRPYFYSNYMTAILFFTLAVVSFTIVRFNYFLQMIMWVLERCPSFLLLNRKERVLQKAAGLHQEYSRTNNYRMLSSVVIYSFVGWMANYLIYLAYLRMFDLKFGLLSVIVCSTLAVITSNIPFINGIGRFGSFELGWLAGFVFVGNMSKDIAIPLGAFVNMLNFIICLIFALAGYAYLNVCVRKVT